MCCGSQDNRIKCKAKEQRGKAGEAVSVQVRPSHGTAAANVVEGPEVEETDEPQNSKSEHLWLSHQIRMRGLGN